MPVLKINSKNELLTEDIDPKKAKLPIPVDRLVGMDFETISLRDRNIEIITWAWYTDKGKLASAFCDLRPLNKVERDRFMKRSFFPWLDKANRIIAHNLSFELSCIALVGYEFRKLQGRVDDSMLMQYVLDTGAPKALKPMVEELFGASTVAYEDAVSIGGDTFRTYAVDDAKYVMYLDKYFAPKLVKEEAVEAYILELYASFEQTSMWLRGFKIDTSNVKNQFIRYEKSLKDNVKKLTKLGGRIINFNSSQQLSRLLYEEWGVEINKEFLTDKMNPGTSKLAIGEIASRPGVDKKVTEFCTELLEMKKSAKILNTFLSPKFLDKIYPDGRIRSDIRMTGTGTGRPSSSNPNMLNIPSNNKVKVRGKIVDQPSEIRKNFVADKGHSLVAADWSQIEYRIFAHFSRDAGLLEGYSKQDADYHQLVADELNIPRSQAKTVNFLLIYQGGVKLLAKRLGLTVMEAKEVVSIYFERIPGAATFLSKAKQFAKHNKYAITLSGKKRRLEASQQRGDGSIDRQGCNVPIQGGVADLMKLTMIKLSKELKKYDAYIILQVYDELIVEVPTKHAKKVQKLMEHVMENTFHFDVPIIAEAKVGKSWYEVK